LKYLNFLFYFCKRLKLLIELGLHEDMAFKQKGVEEEQSSSEAKGRTLVRWQWQKEVGWCSGYGGGGRK
jgi:hypothetical protein